MWSSSWSLANAMLIHLVPTCMHQVVPGHPPLRPDSALLHQSILSLQSKVREEEEHPRKGKQKLKETRHSPEFHSCSKKQYISRFKLEDIYYLKQYLAGSRCIKVKIMWICSDRALSKVVVEMLSGG